MRGMGAGSRRTGAPERRSARPLGYCGDVRRRERKWSLNMDRILQRIVLRRNFLRRELR